MVKNKERKRGILLTVFLILTLLVDVFLGFIVAFAQGMSASSSAFGNHLILISVWNSLCVLATFYWKKWGVFGFLVGPLYLFYDSLQGHATYAIEIWLSVFIWIFLFAALIKPLWKDFE